MNSLYLIRQSLSNHAAMSFFGNQDKTMGIKTGFLFRVTSMALILSFTLSLAQAATYYSRASTAWNVNSTWSTVGYGGAAAANFPKATDIANIGNGNTVTVIAAATCASITIDATGILNPSGSVTVGATTGITVNGTYNNQSTGAITTPSWICNGTYIHASTSVTIPKGSTTTTWAIASNLNMTRAFTSATVITNFIGQTFGNFTFNPSSMTNTVCLFGASGTVTVQGNFTVTQTGSSTLYMRQYGQAFVGVLNINGNFIMSAGIFDMHNGGTTPTISTINLKGNFTLSGTSKITQTTTQSGSTVSFNFTGTSGAQIVSISPTASIASQATTPSCAIQFTVASGAVIDMGTSVLTGTNNTSFTLSPGAGIITANTGGLSSSGATGSIQVNGPRAYSTTANYTYNSTVAGQVTGNGVTGANNLTISNTNASGVTYSNSIAVSGTMAVTSGAYVNLGTYISSAATLALGGVNQTLGTSYGGTGSAAANIIPAYFNAATGVLTVNLPPPSNLSYNSPFAFPLNVPITDQYPTVTGVVTSWGILPSLPAGLSFNTSNGAITGTPTANTASAVYTVTATNSAGSTAFGVVISVGDYRYAVATGPWNSPSTWSLTSGGSSGASVPVSGDIVFIGEASTSYTVTIASNTAAVCGSLTMGNYSAATVATLTFTDGTSSLTVGNDLVMNRPNAAATTVINVNAGSLTVGGTLKLAFADLTPNSATNLINQVNISTGTVTTANLLFNGQSAPQSQMVFSGAGTLNISGNLTFGYILGTLTPSTGTVNFNGTSAQTIPVGVSAVSYNNLKINNTSSGGATLSAAVSAANVTGNLTVGDVNSGSTFDNGGYAMVLASGKSLTVENLSTFKLSGTSTMPAITKTFGATSTVNYSGSAQTVTAESYGHLTLSGSGTKTMPASAITLAGNFTMSGTASATALAVINTPGNFSLGSGTTFNASTFTHTVGGNWTNDGTFTAGTSTIDFNGSNAGSIGASNFNNITFSGAGAKTATGALTIAGNVSISNNFSAGSYNHSVAGNWANSGTFTAGTSTVTFNGTGTQTINNGSSGSFNNLAITNTVGICTATTNNITVSGTFTTNAGTTLDMATYALGVTTVSHSGTLLTQNTSTTPLTAGKTWDGLVSYNSASTAQTAMAGTYNNLTISTTGGATASNNITVNGVLNLAAANPVSGTNGCLEMVTNWNYYPSAGNAVPTSITSSTLYMGPSATTTGTGDVSGIVKRDYQVTANTAYTFGNQYTTVSLTPGTSPVMPKSITMIIKIGVVPAGKAGSVKRSYQILPDGGANCYVIANFHYLYSELNVNTEAKLVTWDYDLDGGSSTPDEHGRAAYDFTNKYIGLSNVPIDYFLYVTGTHAWRTIFELGDHASAKYLTWVGGKSGSETLWTDGANWLPYGVVPDNTCFVIIPNTTYDPVLPATASVNTLTIENGGVLGMASSTLTITNSLSAGWEDQNPGGNDPGTSTVIFANAGATVSGIGRFYNVTINSGASLSIAAGSSMSIGNTFTKTGSFYADIAGSTVDYNQASGTQLVVLPDATPHYDNLILSGSGTKTLPTSDLTVDADLTVSGTVTTSPTNALSIGGDLTIGNGTTFTAGSHTHSIRGNLYNNSSASSFSGSTIVMAGTSLQSIAGTAAPAFYNLTLNNGAGFSLGDAVGATVTGTLALTSGILTTNNNILTVGSAGNAGTISRGSGYVAGTLRRYVPNTLNPIVDYPIGDATNYTPVTIAFAGTTSGSGYLDASVSAVAPATCKMSAGAGLSPTKYVNRRWVVTNSGVNLNGGTYNPTFTFVPGDIQGGANTASFVVRKLDGSAWTATTAGSRTSTSTQCTGLSSFSGFAIGETFSHADTPTLSAPVSSICSGSSTTLSITAGNLNEATSWQWYTGSCGGTPLDNGTSVNVSPTTTTTYYARGESSVCEDPGSCASVTVTVTPPPVAPTSASSDHATICNGEPVILTATGGSGTTLAWYSGSCEGTPAGTGNNIEVYPTATTTYYAHWESDPCGPSGCASVGVVVEAEPPALTGTPYAGTTGTPACKADAESAAPFSATDAKQGYEAHCGGSVTATQTGSSVTGDDCTWTITYTFCVEDAGGGKLENRTYSNTGQGLAFSGNINYYNAGSANLKNVAVKLFQANSEITSASTDGNGAYAFSCRCAGTYEIRATSGQSTEGAVNTTDAAQVNYWGAHQVSIEKVRFHAGDVKGTSGNPDNLIGALDAQRIQQNFVNGTAFDAKPWTYWNTAATISHNPSGGEPELNEYYPTVTLPAAVAINLYGLATGDFNQSFDPDLTKSASETLGLIYAGNRQVSNSQEFDLPLQMVNPSVIGAVSLILNFPAEFVEVMDVTMNGAGGQLDWAVKGDELRIGWNSSPPLYLSAGAELVTLKLKTTDAFTKGNSIRLTLAPSPLNELADASYEVIGNAVLSADVIEASTTGTPEIPSAPNALSFSACPNPFSNFTTISYTLPFSGKVVLEISSILGSKVTTLVSETQTSGNHEVKFYTNDLPPGVYIATLRLRSDQDEMIRSVKLVKNK